MKRLLLTTMTALLLSVGTTWAGPFEDGVAAHKRGDYANELTIFRPLAVQGVAEAQFSLGAMYEGGLGVAQDYAAAAKWLQLAAAQGHAWAQSNLSSMYLNGQGVAQDYVLAYMWISLSAASGDATEASLRDLVARKMTPQQIAQAQKMARDCQRRNFKQCD